MAVPYTCPNLSNVVIFMYSKPQKDGNLEIMGKNIIYTILEILF
jgi:hypothetical protein